MSFKDLESKTKGELLVLAKKLDITGRSLLNKEKLIKKIDSLLTKKKNDRKPKIKIKTIKEEAKQKIKSKEKEVKKRKKIKTLINKKELEEEKVKEEVNVKAAEKEFKEPVKILDAFNDKPVVLSAEVFHEKFHEEIPKPEEISEYYGEDKLVLQVRDPYWAHAYWEITPSAEANIKNILGDEKYYSSDKIMRVYDVTDIDFNGLNARSFFDLFIGNANNWYINVGTSNRLYLAEIGYLTKDGKFYPLVRSNTIHMPNDGPSSVIDEEWMILEDKFREMYALSGGGRSAIASPMFREIFEKKWLLWNLSSEGLSVFSKK